MVQDANDTTIDEYVYIYVEGWNSPFNDDQISVFFLIIVSNCGVITVISFSGLNGYPKNIIVP